MEYFTTNRPIFLVPSYKCDEEFDKIDKYLQFLEKSEVWKIIKKAKLAKCKTKNGRKGYDVYKLFAAILYCFSKFKATLRDIEDKCIFDIRVLYIMEGQIPDYSVIGDFINEYIVPYQYEIFTTITKQIIKEFNLIIEDTYIDGSKFEANANKYKFVWKPTKFHQKLDIKIKKLLLEMGYKNITDNLIRSSDFNLIIKDYIRKNEIDLNNLPRGKGVRNTKEIKKYKLAYKYLIKLLEYEEKEEFCGENRNSYYKTDKDATAMMLKEDYYSKLSNDFHAAYNIQVLVSNLLIVMYGVYQNRTDYYTFIPLYENYYKYYQSYPINAVGDSGYGIYINYKYLRNHNISNYLKFQQWNGESSGKRSQLFYTFNDGVMCLNTNIAKEISFANNSSHQRNKETKLYIFEGCNDNCNYSYKCKKNLKNKEENFRKVELNLDYELLKEEARRNLLSPKGIEIRINRSIQVEGTFGQIKNNMNYERVRRRGLEKVSCEIMLMCLGVNIRRLLNSFEESRFKNNCWNKPNNLNKEIFPYVKRKKKL